jgi:hypothetical protein
MTLWQAKYGVWKGSFINKFTGLEASHTDLQITHVRCPRARLAGCSYQTRISFAGLQCVMYMVDQIRILVIRPV